MARGALGAGAHARSPSGTRVEDGADSFVIRDGRIVAKTVHYTVKR